MVKVTMDEDEFLALCERIWILFEEAGELHARAAEAKRIPAKRSIADDLGFPEEPTVLDEIADKIEFNRVNRQFLLLRVQDMAARS